MTKLLLVEDDNNLREIYEARLAAEGYEISSAKDGEEALEVAKKDKPDLIISDVMMPRISGFEMLDILRNTDGLRNTKIIMLTALGQNEDRTRADNLGADRYLVKSQVTLEDIVKAAAELLDPSVETAEQAATHSADTPAEVPAETTATTQPEQAQPVTAAPQPESAPITEPVAEAAPAGPLPTPVFTEESAAPATDTSTQTIPVVDAPADPAPTTDQASATSDALPTPVFTPPTDDAQAQNDTIINDAVNDLAPAATDAPADDTVQPAPPAEDTSTAAPEPTGPTGGQRVISPLGPSPEQASRPDLATLVAQEEAEESGTANQPIVGGPAVAPQTATSVASPAPAAPTQQPSSTVFQPNEGGSSNQSAL